MIPQSFIQELLSRVDIVDVVGRHVQLKKAGANYLGLCPFHAEKSPSFTVAPTKQFYHCFGCGANGSAIQFLMEHLGLSFPDAVADLAQSVGLTVPHESGRPGDAASQRRDPDLLELMASIAQFYRRRLKDSPRAIEYLKRRGLTGQTAARYALGYAPDGWRTLEAAVPDYDAPELLTTGMVIESQPAEVGSGDAGEGGATAPPASRRRRYDRFRDRIMFPIRNPRGQVIGFGGRVLDKGEPKYMNSPETPLFSKGHELYGLYEARQAMRETDTVVVVEGYMDVAMLAQHGVGNAVATLGTATTPDHVRKLLRQVERVVFAFDGDAAGRKAAWRALQACLPMVSDTKRLDFLFLPPEHDPDSYVREHGADGFRRLLDGAESLSGLLLRELSGRVDLEQAEGRARFLAEARPLLLAMPQAALRMQLVHRVAELARIGIGELNDYLKQGAAADRGAAGAGHARGMGRQSARGSSQGQPGAPDRAGDRSEAPAMASGEPPPWDGDDGWADAPAPRWDDGAPGHDGYGDSRGYRGQGGYGDQGSYGGQAGGGGAPNQKWRKRPWNSSNGRSGGGRFDRPPPPAPPRRPIRPPTLVNRVCLLAALHPTLAHEPVDPQFLPEMLTVWLDQLRGLPAGASFAVVCESLRQQSPTLVGALEKQVAAQRQIVVEMGLEEARQEFDDALRQLRQRGLREAIDQLVAGGLASAEDRQRLQQLQALRVKT